MATSTISSGLSNGSKKIKKEKMQPRASLQIHEDNNDEELNVTVKTYLTFEKAKKKLILEDLSKELNPDGEVCFLGLQYFIKKAGKAQVNYAVEKVISKYVHQTGDLAGWRRKIKRWAANFDKAETRGGPNVKRDLEEGFKDQICKIILNMKFRSFKMLQAKIRKILPKYSRAEVQNNKSCSKHWWFNLMRKYQELKNIWESLPYERTWNKRNRNNNEDFETSDSLSDSDESQISSSAFSVDPLERILNLNLYHEPETEDQDIYVSQEGNQSISQLEGFEREDSVQSPTRFLF